ncbi:MAG: hypothetical protein HZC28_20695 [Spirochaetes bacterium]|nr:hypothetical protein [Spirochaetota bacterium]
MMLRFLFTVLCACAFVFAETNITALFSLSNGAIAYYAGTPMNASDYARASGIRDTMRASKTLVRALIIADVLPEPGNEIVALFNNGHEGYTIFNTQGKSAYTFSIPDASPFVNAAFDIAGYKEPEASYKVLSYYVLRQKPMERHAECYMFRIDADRSINYITEVRFLSEIKNQRGLFSTMLDSMFVDVNGDGYLDLLIAEIQRGVKRNRIEYQVYAYDPKAKTYVFTLNELGQEESANFSSFFVKK